MNSIRTQAIRGAIAPAGNLERALLSTLRDLDPYSPESGSELLRAFDAAACTSWVNTVKLFSPDDDTIALENAWAVVAHLPTWTGLLYRGVELIGSPQAQQCSLRLAKSQRSAWSEEPLLIEIGRCRASAGTLRVPDLLNVLKLPTDMRASFGISHRISKGLKWNTVLGQVSALDDISAADLSVLMTRALEHTKNKSLHRLQVADLARLSPMESAVLKCCGEVHAQLLPKKFVDSPTLISDFKSLRDCYQRNIKTIKVIADSLARGDWNGAGSNVAKLSSDEIVVAAARDFCMEFTSQKRFSFDPMSSIGRTSDQSLIEPDEEDRVTESDEVDGDDHDSNIQFVSKWKPISDTAAERLNAIFGAQVIAERWKLTATEIANGLINKSIFFESFTPTEQQQLQSTWTPAVQNSLVAANCFSCLSLQSPVWSKFKLERLLTVALADDIDGLQLLVNRIRLLCDPAALLQALLKVSDERVNQLAKAAVNVVVSSDGDGKLGLDGWASWISKAIESRAWKLSVAAKLIEEASLRQLTYALEMGYWDISSPAMKKGFLNQLQDGNGLDLDVKIAESIARLMAGRIEMAEVIPPSISASLATILVSLEKDQLTDDLLEKIYKNSTGDTAKILWKERVLRVTSAEDFSHLIVEGARLKQYLEWSDNWNLLTGTILQRANAMVLAARRDPDRLKKLRLKFGDEVMQLALKSASDSIREINVGDAVYLELLSVIGLRHGPTLRWLLAQRNRSSAAGCKVDHLYSRHELPKKSGGTRVISVPENGLKRVQKALLVKLISPLGAHDKAFGFVTGRSIRDNASIHVGQPIVANADVRNCFPSVRWPLVLAALRRDLNEVLSGQSISCVIDICTAEGGLPIGAPTSPALLNRVLFRTDQILDDQAKKRGCNYSRYADDVSFSGDHEAVRLLGVAKKTLQSIGLELDPRKTNIFRRGRRQICTGLVVNDQVSVPRRIRRRLRAAVHAVENGKPAKWHGEVVGVSSIKGRLSFLNMINPEEAQALINRLNIAVSDGSIEKFKSKGGKRSKRTSADDSKNG